MHKPTLYLSDFFERHKGAYYDSLTFVRTRNDLDQWIVFFLSGIIETANKGKNTFEKIITLRGQYEKKIMSLGRRAKLAHNLLLHLFSNPATSVADTSRQLDIAINTANTLVNEMEHKGILREVTGFSRNRIFVLHDYLNLFRS